MTTDKLKGLLTATYSRWNRHNAPRLGASLAYYTLLSTAPLTIVIVAICGVVFDKTTAKRDVLNQARDVVGTTGAATLEMLMGSAQHRGSGLFAGMVAAITLLFGASGVF